MDKFKLQINKALGLITSSVSPQLFFVLSYLHNRGKFPNLNDPTDLSEIWIKYFLSGKVKSNYYLADKYKVRKYVTEKGLDSILTPLIGVYDEANNIDFDNLPNRFALKANYGAGMNIICIDKSKFDIDRAKDTANKWISRPSTYSHAESHYNLIEHKIICEEFIDDGNGGFPIDYKFLCLKGKVACILACSCRESSKTHYAHYDTNWNFIPAYDKLHRAGDAVPKPRNLSEMIKTAERLAEGLDMVRVDLYSNGSKIWFGEMTLTPAGCIFHGWSQRALDDMGKFFHSH